jgi:hypothetical protein
MKHSAWDQRFRTALASFVLLMLAACGPGTEGTGAGIDDVDDDIAIAYTPMDLCTAPFAATALSCPAERTGTDLGTEAVQWADANKSNEGAQILVVLEGNVLRLRIPCREASVEGRWGMLTDGALAFVGRYMDPIAVGNGLPATVRIIAAKDEPEAVGWLEIYGQFGNPIYDSTLVRRVEGTVLPAECPR